jgi:hypothetical protein
MKLQAEELQAASKIDCAKKDDIRITSAHF